jgi:hypothetical protein
MLCYDDFAQKRPGIYGGQHRYIYPTITVVNLVTGNMKGTVYKPIMSICNTIHNFVSVLHGKDP